MSASHPPRQWPWLPLAFASCALAFAALRIPYEDEWYSIELAAEPDPARFWRALGLDMHPPWLAVVDRALYGLWPSWHALSALRVLCATAAIATVAPLLAARLRVPVWLPWLAALHPLVLMYAGCARWYPLVMLGQALRVRALWGDAARPASRAVAFATGATLGSMAGYVDAWLLLHDAAFWLVRSARDPRTGERRLALLASASAAVCVVVLRLVSPLGAEHGVHHAGFAFALQPVASFFGIGALFEAAPPWPWALLAVLVPLVHGYGLLVCLRSAQPPGRGALAYLASAGCAWLVATQFGVWHPRYALLWWWLLSACALAPAVRVRPVRVAFALAGSYALLVVALMALGRGYLKSDLNALERSDCAVLEHAPPPVLAVVPYVRLQLLIRARCSLRAPMAGLPSIRIYGDERSQLQSLRSTLSTALARPGEVWLLHVLSRSSLSVSEARARALLATRCRLRDRAPFAAAPHAALRRPLHMQPAPFRFERERWTCR